MNTDAKNCRSHPDDSMLMRVSLGKADITETMIIEAHIHYCIQCYDKYFNFQQNLINDFQSLDTLEIVSTQTEGDSILTALNGKLDALEDSDLRPSDSTYELLPPALLSSMDTQAELKWNSFWPSKGKVSLLAEDRVGQYQLFIGVIDPGATLPGHRHSLNEQTLVLKGQYIVDDKVFEAGEWSESTKGEEHAPSAGKNEHCYCLIRANKQGYKFTGSSRWRNPLLSIFT
ncbi:MAG: cupin domain-containing protein [Oligoflexales bacterium]